MRLIGADIELYKSLENVFLPLEGLVVLFGPNGAGKSNALEAAFVIVEASGGIVGDEGSFRFRERADVDPRWRLNDVLDVPVIELTNSDTPNHLEAHLWASVIAANGRQRNHAPIDPAGPDEREDDILGGNELLLNALSALEVSSSQDALGRALDVYVTALVDGGNAGDPADRELLARAIMRSRVLGWHFWTSLYVSRRQLGEPARQAVERVASASGTEEDLLWRCARRLTGGPSNGWTRVGALNPPVENEIAPLPDVVVVDPRPEGLEVEVYRDIRFLDAYLFAKHPLMADVGPDAAAEEGRMAIFGEEEQSLGIPHDFRRRDPWLESQAGGWRRVSPRIRRLAGLLAKEANAIGPSFIQEAGLIGVELFSPDLWHETPERLNIVFREPEGPVHNFKELGSGMARWIAASIREASRRMRSWRLLRKVGDEWEDKTEENIKISRLPYARLGYTQDMRREERLLRRFRVLGAPSQEQLAEAVYLDEGTRLVKQNYPALFLIDEPEANLHPKAMLSVAKWIAKKAQDSAGVLIATHAVPFLDLPSESASFQLVTRADGRTAIQQIDADVIGVLEMHAEHLGITKGQLIQLVRAILIVEGIQDEAVIKYLYGDDLSASRLAMLPLSGVNEALALVEAEFLARLGKPLILLFDNVLAEKFKRGRLPTGPETTHEERMLAKLRAFARDKKAFTILDNPLPDIICALPDDSVRRVLKSVYRVSFPGWDELIAAHRAKAGRGKNFKDFFLERCEIEAPIREVLDKILSETPRQPVPGPLHRAIQQALAVAAAHDAPRP